MLIKIHFIQNHILLLILCGIFFTLNALTLVPSHEQLLIEAQHDQELQSRLAHCIDKLPLRQREVIRYIFFDKYSYEKASHLVSISIRSVYTLAWKAIASLRKSI